MKKRKRERKEKDAPFLLFLELLSKYTWIRLSFLEADQGVENWFHWVILLPKAKAESSWFYF